MLYHYFYKCKLVLLQIIFLAGVINLCSIKNTKAQNVGIGTSTPHSSAQLDINASGKGLLIPRMDSTARIGIVNPANGLMVFDTSTFRFFVFINPILGWKPFAVENYFYADRDGDTYGDKFSVMSGATPLPGFVTDNSDCNDNDPFIHYKVFFKDFDNDGFYDETDSVIGCVCPQGYIDEGLLMNTMCNALATLGIPCNGISFVDCNDNNDNIHPNLPFINPQIEICNGIDDNCNGVIDEGILIRWVRDFDSDGFGNDLIDSFSCSQPSGYVAYGMQYPFNLTDCNDSNNSIHPLAPEICDGIDNNCDNFIDNLPYVYYQDADGDGFGNSSVYTTTCPIPAGYVLNGTDCNDADSNIHPLKNEICNNSIDENCNGILNENMNLYVKDNDGDGFPNLSINISSCTSPGSNYMLYNTNLQNDCNDNDSTIHPNHSEICGNGIDDNCNGIGDDLSTWYKDLDNDSAVDFNSPSISSCTQPIGYILLPLNAVFDCNDTNATIPGPIEICSNGLDDNCDGQIDEQSIWYSDNDADGKGSVNNSIFSCIQPPSYVANSDDCDDSDPNVYYGALEINGNDLDDNCNGYTDEKYYLDADNDGYAQYDTLFVSNPTTGYVQTLGDCNDTNSSIHPNTIEILGDGIDNDCDGTTDMAIVYPDIDGDGFGYNYYNLYGSTPIYMSYVPVGFSLDLSDCDDSNPQVHNGGVEICNGLDDNCNGNTDEGSSIKYYADNDNDGFGNFQNYTFSCTPPFGNWVTIAGDCDDNNNNINPNAVEIIGDSIDNNCDGNIQ